ncbi:MAG TPA: O-antigen ligase family protein [Candidatus Paceibacterota bacterium]|nr:O-antigen ligase family protein [Candidatus Paceibacterota bacterium]
MQAKRVAEWAALGALFLIPLTPLIVANSFFFPFITGKAFYFRIMVEIATAAWAVLAVLDKAYRPRFSWIGATVLGFVVWMFIADVFAVNTLKAFWSNFERMEGWVLVIHLGVFFVVSSSVLRVKSKWRAWFLASLAVSVVLVVHALFQLMGLADIHQGSTRIDSSLGNSAYFAVYLLFNVFLAGWLALTETRPWLKRALLALAGIEAILIFFTETRGTVLALLGGVLLASLLTALTADGRARRYAAGAFILIALIASGFYLARNSSVIQENRVLQRIGSISLNDGKVRFTIWHMAWQGFQENPMLGWGQEGFNYVFNTYYDPALYKQEPWFDRAHNAFIDWLMAGGLPALMLYLALFGTAITLLWTNSSLSRPERIALTAALAGYACHNFFVFDNLYSYIYFFSILALIDSQVSRPIPLFERMAAAEESQGTVPLAIGTALALGLIYFINVSGMTVASNLIVAISPSSSGAEGNLATFQNLLQHPSFAAQEVREQLVSIAAGVAGDAATSETVKKQFAAFAISEVQKQDAAHPGDARTVLQLAAAYRTAGDLPDALKEVREASALSPGKEQIFIQAAATEWDLGDTAAAKIDFEKAYALGPQFPDLAAYAAAGNIVVGDAARAQSLLLDAFGTTTVDSEILAYAYYQVKDFPRLIAVWRLRTAQPDAPIDSWFGLAAAYFLSGNKPKAIAVVNEAVALHPEAAEQAKAVIAQIETTSVPQ